LTVKTFTVNNTNEKLMILFFEETDKPEDKVQLPFSSIVNPSPNVEELDHELLLAKDLLQALNHKLESSNEELETSIEELETANEELIVSNEELQSTNEELQSGNEELIAINNEFQFKIQELTDLNDDVTNFLNSTNIATVFLDEKLNIRKFTPAAAKVINLKDKQIGLLIDELLHNFKYEHLVMDARKVLLTSEPIEKEVQSLNGEWLLIKILPFLSIDNLPEGVAA